MSVLQTLINEYGLGMDSPLRPAPSFQEMCELVIDHIEAHNLIATLGVREAVNRTIRQLIGNGLPIQLKYDPEELDLLAGMCQNMLTEPEDFVNEGRDPYDVEREACRDSFKSTIVSPRKRSADTPEQIAARAELAFDTEGRGKGAPSRTAVKADVDRFNTAKTVLRRRGGENEERKVDPIHGKAPRKGTLAYDIWRAKCKQDRTGPAPRIKDGNEHVGNAKVTRHTTEAALPVQTFKKKAKSSTGFKKVNVKRILQDSALNEDDAIALSLRLTQLFETMGINDIPETLIARIKQVPEKEGKEMLKRFMQINAHKTGYSLASRAASNYDSLEPDEKEAALSYLYNDLCK